MAKGSGVIRGVKAAVAVRSRLWCHNAINRLFTSTALSRPDHLNLSWGIFALVTRAESSIVISDGILGIEFDEVIELSDSSVEVTFFRLHQSLVVVGEGCQARTPQTVGTLLRICCTRQQQTQNTSELLCPFHVYACTVKLVSCPRNNMSLAAGQLAVIGNRAICSRLEPVQKMAK